MVVVGVWNKARDNLSVLQVLVLLPLSFVVTAVMTTGGHEYTMCGAHCGSHSPFVGHSDTQLNAPSIAPSAHYGVVMVRAQTAEGQHLAEILCFTVAQGMFFSSFQAFCFCLFFVCLFNLGTTPFQYTRDQNWVGHIKYLLVPSAVLSL